MSIREYQRYSFALEKLQYAGKDTGLKLVRDEKYDHMYWIVGDALPGGRSAQMYNLTNAKDNAKIFDMRSYRSMATERPTEVTGAFK